ncbi:MAG: hypothetical protein HYY84_16475 [Deltaproteobacteria bacterium]|nr:hypothetical protein [Deltaproteobacteria bacterium]
MQTTGSTTQPARARPDWEEELIQISVLYLALECGQKMPLVGEGASDLQLIESELATMQAKGLIGIEGQAWIVTKEGRAMLGQVVKMCDQLMKFEIFGGVRLTRELTPDERLDDDPLQCRDHVYDPRFAAPGEEDREAKDLRLAMITFLTEQMSEALGGQEVDPRRLVFLQKLSSGRFPRQDFWFQLRLGTYFRDVEKIAQSAYQWRQIDPSSEENSMNAMRILYTAGMLEQRKRDGNECGGCGIPLAVFELGAAQNKQELTKCPNPDCGADYNPPKALVGFACPACNRDIHDGQTRCGCGAIIDRSLMPGTVQTETVAHTETVYETVWGHGYGYYGYVPYGYYDPWDPFVDVLAFGCLCAVLW